MNPRFLRFLTPAQQATAIADEHLFAMLDDVVRITQSRLAGGHIDLDRKDVEAAYNLAWNGVWQRIAQGGKVENLTGLLVDITYKRSLDIYRQRHEGMHTDATFDETFEGHATAGDLAEQADDREKLMGLFERLRDRLNENERNAVVLCIVHGYSRAEAAKQLEIPEPAFQKIIDAAWKKVASVAAFLDARGCGDDEWARALRSFALGLIDDEHECARISAHVEECESCRRYVHGLRGLAAVFPPLGLRFAPFAHHHAGLLHVLAEWVRRLLGGGHASSAGGSTAGASAAGGSTAGAGAAGIGAVKVAAIIVGLAAAGVTVKVATGTGHRHRPPNQHRQPPPALAARNPAAIRPLSPIVKSPSRLRRSAHATRLHTTAAYVPPPAAQRSAIREFGVERAHTATATTTVPALAPKPTIVAPAQHAQPAREGEREDFSFEK